MASPRTTNKRFYCRYGERAALCRYYAAEYGGECMSVYAYEAARDQTKGFFNGSARRCRGFRDRTPSSIAAQREYFWDHCETMAKEIHRDRVAVRKTLAKNPALICADCPEFLLPSSF